MTRLLFCLFSSIIIFCGCAHTYVITLDNGRRITAPGKPKLQDGRYVYKDASGRAVFIPATKVREIAPASMANEEKARFNPQPQTK
jgi:hypothetical protein